MSEQLRQAHHWLSEADSALLELPEPTCKDADKLATIVQALHIACVRLASAIDNLERDLPDPPRIHESDEDFNPEGLLQ